MASPKPVTSRSIGLLGLVALAIACSACTSGAPAASPPRRASVRRDSTSRAASASTPTTPTPALQAPLGAPSILADGSGAALSVTALGVVDPGTGADALALPETGERLVGVAIQLANRGRSVVTDVDADTTVIGSNGQTFGHVDDPLTECTPFPLGAQTLAPGTTLRGCVTFELPLGVSVSKIAFRPTAGSVPGQAGEWNAG